VDYFDRTNGRCNLSYTMFGLYNLVDNKIVSSSANAHPAWHAN